MALAAISTIPMRHGVEETYRSAGWSHVTLEEADGLGYDRQQTRWLHVFAQP